MQYHARAEQALLVDLLDRVDVLHAFREEPVGRDGLRRRLDVSVATSYRLTGWLREQGLLAETDDGFQLTRLGEAIRDVAVTFERDVASAAGRPTDPDTLSDIVRYAPHLRALANGPLYRRELQERLDVSRATSHRHTGALAEMGLIERVDGAFALTDAGRGLRRAVTSFENDAGIAFALGPVLDVIDDTEPGVDPKAFSGATVTSAEGGSAYSPMDRATSLFRESESFRGLDPASIAPLYMEEFHGRVLAGVETEIIQTPEVTAEVMANYPEACVEVCVSEYFTHWLHDALPFGLVIFDGRVGVGVRDPDGRTPRAFVDTDDPDVREWAESVFEAYREDAVLLERFTEPGLAAAREALDGAA